MFLIEKKYIDHSKLRMLQQGIIMLQIHMQTPNLAFSPETEAVCPIEYTPVQIQLIRHNCKEDKLSKDNGNLSETTPEANINR
jgi:hypothetical protein